MNVERIIPNVRILSEAGFSNKKIARIVYGDAHPMCVELVEIDKETIERGAVALFFDDLSNYQKQMDVASFIAKCTSFDDLFDEEAEEDLEEL